jgi:hypothetical protein
MARYRVNNGPGVFDTLASADVFPSNYLAWKEYQDWLADGNVPDPPPPAPPEYAALPAQRAEALARLDSYLTTRRDGAVVTAVGHAWKCDPIYVVAALVHRAAMPPVPPGFTLPDAARVQVPLNSAQLSELVTAYSDRLVAFNARYSALVAAITASPTPLAVDITSGWPS